jgi:small subunit ribosomal protein S9
VARVRLAPGSGVITVNRRSFENYFPRETLRMIIEQPLRAVNAIGKFNAAVTVSGGGISGQAEAIRLGIARALVLQETTNKPSLRRAGLLTRDARVRERKKYGQKGARRRFQWTKR